MPSWFHFTTGWTYCTRCSCSAFDYQQVADSIRFTAKIRYVIHAQKKVDANVVRVLANNPGCLDLYTWLTWRCYQAKSAERIPLFGAFGLAAQLGVQEYARERKFRERIKEWLKLVRLYWPECPAIVSQDGRSIALGHCASITRGT